MEYQYTAYTTDRKLIRGRINAPSEEKAIGQLNAVGYQVLNIGILSPVMRLLKSLDISFTAAVKIKEVIMFSRQLALLLESGIDIVSAIDLFKTQASNKAFKAMLESIVTDLRAGTAFSVALSKFPKVFSMMYYRTIAAGEQSGNLDQVLRRMADYMERTAATQKKIKSAMTYPIVVLVVSIVVVGVLVFFVLPTFMGLYETMGANLPTITKVLMSIANGAKAYGAYLLLGLIAAVIAVLLYARTPKGRVQIDSMILRLPVIGPIAQLNELARCSRTISMLIKVGLPLPDIMTMCIQSAGNKIVVQALSDVKQEMLGGEGLAVPMQKRSIFLPLMVQMVAVGEKTGNLGNTLTTVADAFEADSEDKTSMAIGLMQPAMTIGLAVVVGFIVLAMLSAMYGIYGQLSG